MDNISQHRSTTSSSSTRASHQAESSSSTALRQDMSTLVLDTAEPMDIIPDNLQSRSTTIPPKANAQLLSRRPRPQFSDTSDLPPLTCLILIFTTATRSQTTTAQW